MKKLLVVLLIAWIAGLVPTWAQSPVRVQVWNEAKGPGQGDAYYLGLRNPVQTFYLDDIGLGSREDTDTFTVRETAFIYIKKAGTYTFSTTSDDGSMLWIGDWWVPLGETLDPDLLFVKQGFLKSLPLTRVVLNDAWQGDTTVSGTINLQAGVYGLMVCMYEGSGGETLLASYSGPDTNGWTMRMAANTAFDLAIPSNNLVKYEIWNLSTAAGSEGLLAPPYKNNTVLPDISLVRSTEGIADYIGMTSSFNVSFLLGRDYFLAYEMGIYPASEAMALGLGVSSDDGSLLWTGKWWEQGAPLTRIADNQGLHGMQYRAGQIDVNAGLIGIVAMQYEHSGDEGLEVSYWTPEISRTVLKEGLLVAPYDASRPYPANGQANVPLEATLTWTAPVLNPSAQMKAYFGPYAGTLTEQAITQNSFKPTLEMDKAYQWRVDVLEPNNQPGGVPTVRTGAVWAFSTVTSDITIVQQPIDHIVPLGTAGQLTVVAESALPLQYSWKKDGQYLGVGGSVLATPGLQPVNNGLYSCEITNGVKTVETRAARVAVKQLMAYYPLDGDLNDHANELDPSASGDKDGVYMVNDPNVLDAVTPNMTVQYIPGKSGLGQAVLFNGVDQFVSLGTWDPSQVTNQLTVALWARWNGHVDNLWQGLIGKRNSWSGTNMRWQIELDLGTADLLRNLRAADQPDSWQGPRIPEKTTLVSRGGYVEFSSENPSTSYNERAYRAFDGATGSKWLAFQNTGWLTYIFPEDRAYVITSYQITSANDAPERDPDNWTLEGSNDGLTWAVIDTQAGKATSWTARNQTVTFNLPANATAYKRIKLNVSKIRTPSVNIVQIAEVALFANTALTADETWVHIASTFDGTNATLFINGRAVITKPSALGPKTDANLLFGADELNPTGGSAVSSKPWGGNFFNGALDDIRLYNYGMTASEVLALYKQTVPGGSVCLPGTQPEYDFDQDCTVDVDDLLMFMKDWLADNSAGL
jgi:hypothetical protein